MRRSSIALIAVGLLLTGCTGTASAAKTTTTPTPTESPAATEKQVASVIAEHEADWREVIDNAISCRTGWTFSPGDIHYAACYVREKTMILTAKKALNDLAELKIPASMQSLVDDTSKPLQLIANTDLIGACGDDFSAPNDTDACNKTLGTLNFAYTLLKDKLDAWQPYM